MNLISKTAAIRPRPRWVWGGVAALAVSVPLTLGLVNLQPAVPAIERSEVWIGQVRRGDLVRQVRGTGTLVPEVTRWIPAGSEGRVEQVLVQPGATVQANTILLELSNPELEQNVLDARLQLEAAQAEIVNLQVQFKTERLNKQASLASISADYYQAQLQFDTNQELASQGIMSELQLKLSQVKVKELAGRLALEHQLLANSAGANRAQLSVQEARVAQARTLYELRLRQLVALKVRAGIAGVLQEVPVEVGQLIQPGANLARIANPARLKAQIRIAETQAKDIQLGQAVTIDTRNGLVKGKVARIDPAVREGTVTVDVQLTGVLPRGVRPDLSVDGTVELERLPNVLYVDRPALGQEFSTLGLFQLEANGIYAQRVRVQLGQASVNTIEVRSGLKAGDQVILSETSAQDSFKRIRLN
ncbi:efflux RND transporter periplasmic adaptor subunit [Anthocerotibacter panamensis]|uniref:efflux RND transporter periplasmic adaptor subunit n=1 Tax=Anthocerotibacter panamensis TaxID=2857077 RepID=UPI001C401684|nr:HlyD family efflux transporter periplasmic adaptor subunit [Anthocerotibacter panamensis]